MDKRHIPYQFFTKKIKFFILFFFLLSLSKGQNFRVSQFSVNFDDYVKVLDDNLSASFHGEILSNHSDTLDIKSIVSFANLPEDWIFTTCISTNCYSSDIDTIDFFLVPNSPAEIRIDVTATFFDTGNIELEFFEESNLEGASYLTLSISDYITGLNSQLISEKTEIVAYPNPFNNNLSVKINSKISESVSMKFYNIKGEIVNVLNDFQVIPGVSTLKWSAINSHGNKIQSGIYFISIHGKSFNNFVEVLYIK